MDTCFFDTIFWQRLVIGIIVIALGIPSALFIHRLKKRLDKKSDQKNKRTESINKLRQSLPIILSTFNQIMDEVKGPSEGAITREKIDLTAIDNIASQNYDFFAEDINPKLNKLQENLQKLNDLIKNYSSFHKIAQEPSMFSYIDQYHKVKKLIIQEEDRIRNLLTDLISLINK